MKSALIVPMSAAALALASCSSPPPPPPPAPAPAASAPASSSPELIEAGVLMETASGMVTVESIDKTNRTLVLKRADGTTFNFKAGPEVRRFNEIKAGDQIMSTVTDNATIFVVKGKMTPSAAARQDVVRTPEGQNLGAIVVNALNMNATVLDVDLEARRVLLQYGPDQTKSVKVKPDMDLGKIHVGDTVLIRGTQTISIMVASP